MIDEPGPSVTYHITMVGQGVLLLLYIYGRTRRAQNQTGHESGRVALNFGAAVPF